MRPDAIVATGRSDYPNQINNVLGFPFIFRGALDVQARTINEAMKIAAAKALAELAREDVPDQVAAAFLGRQVRLSGRDYIIPAPFDPRLISRVPPAVAKAAMDTGVARKPIADMDAYVGQLVGPARSGRRLAAVASSRRCAPTPSASSSPRARRTAVIRAANAFHNAGLGAPVLIGRERPIARAPSAHAASACDATASRSTTRSLAERRQEYAEFLYARLQRKGYLLRDCQRLVNQRPQRVRRLHGGAGPCRRAWSPA